MLNILSFPLKCLERIEKVRTFALAFENYLSKQLKNNPNSIEYNFSSIYIAEWSSW